MSCYGCERSKSEMAEKISISSGIYQNKNWESFEFPISDECVPNSDTAISIAQSIMLNFKKEGMFKDYSLQSVFFDTQDKIWIVSFYPDKKGYAGSDFHIAIRRDNAQVVKMWVLE